MIEINNLAAKKITPGFLEKIAKKVIMKEAGPKLKNGWELSIVLLGPSKMKELNKRYRGQDKATDVLSFEYDDSGEIVICLSEVRKNAKEFGFSFKKELARVLIHGLLHLWGYDHEKSVKAAKEMARKENAYLSLALN